jgi:outer membrane protein TolC
MTPLKNISIYLIFFGFTIFCHGDQRSSALTNQTEKIILTLEEVLSRSLKWNPEIKRINVNLAEKLANATETQIPPNPAVQLDAIIPDARIGDFKNSPNYEVELTQTIRLTHFGLRQTYAIALENAATLEQQAELIRVLNDTALLYYRLWILQQREEMLRESEKQAQDVTKRITEAIEKEETPTTEANLFKAEAIRFGIELKATQGERIETQAELLNAIGMVWQDIKMVEPKLAPIPDFKTLEEFAHTRSNLRTLILARQRAANRRYDVARMDIFPQLSPRLLYHRANSGREEDWGIGIEFSIPLWDWNQAENKRAKAAKELADAEVTAFENLSLERMIQIRQKQATALQLRAESYWKDVLPAYKKGYELSRYMFEQGQASMLQLWQVQQRLIELSESTLKSMADALAARTLLEQAIGGKIEEIP